MTRPELKSLYKKETGRQPILDSAVGRTSIPTNYRYYQEYVEWLEDKLTQIL